jgi:hypothetical protein
VKQGFRESVPKREFGNEVNDERITALVGTRTPGGWPDYLLAPSLLAAATQFNAWGKWILTDGLSAFHIKVGKTLDTAIWRGKMLPTAPKSVLCLADRVLSSV